MKKTLVLIIASLTITINGISQTTLEEYNYITKGYKVQIESGLDMKKGYEFEDVDKVKIGIRVAELKKLINGQKKIAAYMIIYQKENGPKDYICIPSPNSDKEVTDAFLNNLYNGSGDNSAKLQLFTYLLSRKLNW